MLRQRIVTALIIAAALLALLWRVPPESAIWIFALILLLGAWEWSAFVGLRSRFGKGAYVTALGAGMLAVWFGTEDAREALVMVLWAAAAWWLVALLWILWWPTRVSAILAALAGMFSLIPAWVALSHLHSGLEHGPQWVLFLFVLVAMADIGAFLVGRKLGRTKLAPRVSPGKTWEGVAGGVASSLVAAAVGAYWFGLDLGRFLLVCGFVIIGSVIGDLSESLFKRHVNLKDSSQLLPGHGGVLDRIDSMTAAAPLFLLGLIWMDVFK